MEVPQKMKNITIYDPAIPYLSIFQRKKNTVLETHMHPYVHCSIKKNNRL